MGTDATTNYQVKLDFLLNDKASRGMASLGREAQRTSASVAKVDNTLRNLATAAAGYFSFRAAGQALIGYNNQLEQTQAKLRAIIDLNTQGGTFGQKDRMASDLMLKFQKDAQQSAGTMADMADFAAAIANGIFQAGGGMEDLRLITKRSVVAASALGSRPDMAQLDITQALQGTVGARDRFAMSILKPLGYAAAEFNKLTAPERLKVLKSALDSPAIRNAAKAYETSWEGVTSTLKDNMQQLAGKIGKPLFEELKGIVAQMNEWIAKNPAKIKEFVKDVQSGIKSAMSFLKGVVGFLVEHKGVLLAIAKGFAITKMGQIAAGPVQGLLGGIQNLTRLGGAAGSATGALGRFSSSLGIFAATYGIAKGAAAYMEGKQEEWMTRDDKNAAFSNTVRDALKHGDARSMSMLLDRARASGAIDKHGNINSNKTDALFKTEGIVNDQRVGLNAAFTVLVKQALAKEKSMKAESAFGDFRRKAFLDLSYKMGENMAKGMSAHAQKIAQDIVAGMQGFDQWGAKMISSAFDKLLGRDPSDQMQFIKPGGDVKIGKLVMTVESNDPDAFAVGFESYLRGYARNPTTPPRAIRDGR